MTVSTSSSLSSLFNTIFEDAIFVAREQNLMAGLVTNTTGSGMAARKLGIYPQLTASEVAEGTDFVSATEWTKTLQMTITPKIVMAQTIITKSQIETDPDDTRQDAARELGGAIATKVDTDLVGLFTGFSKGKGSAGATLTISNCAAAIAVLRNNKSPNPVWVVLQPYGWHDIWTALGQPTANQAFLGDVANEAMRSYFVGQFLSAFWFVDANIAIDALDDSVGAAFHREALELDTRMAPSLAVEEDPSIAGHGFELTMQAWYGVGERRDSFGVKLTHDALEPT